MEERKRLLDELNLEERKLGSKRHLLTPADSAVSNLGFRLALEGEDYLNQKLLKLENDAFKVEKQKNEKRERENLEKNYKDYEDFLIQNNQELARSLN